MRKNLYVIADFDHTITSKDSKSSWGVLETSTLQSKRSQKKSQEYLNYYIKKEKDPSIPFDEKKELMKEWANKNMDLFIENKLKKKDIDKISKSKNCMNLRNGVEDFFEFTYQNNIPLIIISAGITDIIENFLKANKLLYDNVHIISNKIKYSNNIIAGFTEKTIHVLGKDKAIVPHNVKEIIKDKNQVLLLGDNIEDTYMIPKKLINSSIKIGFINGNTENYKEYKKYFDYIFDDESTFTQIIEIIKGLM